LSLKDDLFRRSKSAYPLQFHHRILYSDMDAFRHVNNGATGRYFEEGRADLNMRIFGESCMTDPPGGLQLLFARVEIEYLRQAHYPGSVEVCTGLARIGSSSYVQAQAAFQGGHCFALAEAVMVKAVDGRPVPLTKAERSAMAVLMLMSPDSTHPGEPQGNL